jgi:hypothetical protein
VSFERDHIVSDRLNVTIRVGAVPDGQRRSLFSRWCNSVRALAAERDAYVGHIEIRETAA